MPLSINLTDKSTDSSTSWKWTFGDGNTSKTQNPVYKYNKTGSFTVGLTVTNPEGSSTETMTGYISVKQVKILELKSFKVTSKRSGEFIIKIWKVNY